MLEVQNLFLNIDKNIILNGVNIQIAPGEIHMLMGPNGSGKSTLSKLIMGYPDYKISQGKIIFNKKDITSISVESRAKLGIFLAFQYPIEIPGLSFKFYLRSIYNNLRTASKKLPPYKFQKILSKKASLFNIDNSLLERNLNENLSGGEKKKMEILQMSLLKPKMVIIDEIDSGLDIDAIKDIFLGLKKYIKQNPDTSFLIITHYQKIFKYITPDHIHIMVKGKITKNGGMELITQLNKQGYKKLATD